MSGERSLTPSSLGRFAGKEPANEDERGAMMAAAWHKLGLPILPLHKIANDIDRIHVEQIATRLYGRRNSRPNDKDDQR